MVELGRAATALARGASGLRAVRDVSPPIAEA
jgi:hypothetical protein